MITLRGQALDALAGRGRDVMGSDASAAADALGEVAGLISCAYFGHPEQPRWLLRRYQQRPWRCARCQTWWVTEPRTSWGEFFWGWEQVECR